MCEAVGRTATSLPRWPSEIQSTGQREIRVTSIREVDPGSRSRVLIDLNQEEVVRED